MHPSCFWTNPSPALPMKETHILYHIFYTLLEFDIPYCFTSILAIFWGRAVARAPISRFVRLSVCLSWLAFREVSRVAITSTTALMTWPWWGPQHRQFAKIWADPVQIQCTLTSCGMAWTCLHHIYWHPPDTFLTPSRHPPDTFQTPTRHTSDNFQTPPRHPQEC